MVITSTFSDQAPLTISFYKKESAGTRDLDGSDEKFGYVWLKLNILYGMISKHMVMRQISNAA